jgi:hypothetical protein
MSASERPLTSATAPPVRSRNRSNVCRSDDGTRTAFGVGARSSSVPSMSSRKARLGTSINLSGTIESVERERLGRRRAWGQEHDSTGDNKTIQRE